MNAKQRQSVDSRVAREKEKLLDELKKAPVIHAALKLSGVSKATYYRWRTDDPEFAIRADAAMNDGKELVSDMAISQLISAIKDKNVHALKFWLTHHHPDFRSKVEVTGTLRVEREMTPEELELKTQALKLAGLHHGADTG